MGKKELGDFIKKVGYNLAGVPFVPISGFEGVNMFDTSQNDKMPWYKGWSIVTKKAKADRRSHFARGHRCHETAKATHGQAATNPSAGRLQNRWCRYRTGRPYRDRSAQAR